MMKSCLPILVSNELNAKTDFPLPSEFVIALLIIVNEDFDVFV